MKKRIPVQFHSNVILYVVCVEDCQGIEDFAAKEGIEIPDDKMYMDGLFAKMEDKFYIVFHKKTTEGDIAHECTHFLNTVYLAIGQQLDAENDEMYCHQLGFFTNECLKFQKKYK